MCTSNTNKCGERYLGLCSSNSFCFRHWANRIRVRREATSVLDLAHTLLYVMVQLVKSDGSEIDGGSKVASVNLFLLV